MSTPYPRLQTAELRAPSFLHPNWFLRARAGFHESVVDDSGAVMLEGQSLAFLNPREAFAPGTPVLIWLGSRQFVCCPKADYDAHQKALAARRQAEEDAERARFDRERDEAIAFNATLKLPVAWRSGQKDVLSGLSETSWGDGRNRRSVTHILLLEPLQVGRIRRKKDDFLCTSASASNGRRWAGTEDVCIDGHGRRYQSRVTCVKCLRLAARWTVGETDEST